MSIFHGSRDKSFVIKRPRADSWPKNMGCISVWGDYQEQYQEYIGKAPEHLRFGKLKSWEACFFNREKDSFGRSHWHDGKDSEDFWRTLRLITKSSGTVWIWGWKIWPAWCLLDGIKEISEQRLILNIRDSKEQPPGVVARPRRTDGLFVADNPPTIICLAVPGGGRIKIIDLANYGIEPEDFGVNGPQGALAATVHALKEYVRLCKAYDMGSCQTTAASQAWYCYRRSHMDYPVTVTPTEKVLALEQAAYYGGRCECMRLGHFKEKLYHFDVNSMYTSIGVNLMFPQRHCSTWDESMEGHPPIPSHMKLGIADVTIDAPWPLWPARESVKTHHDKPPCRPTGRERIIYPIGIFRTALAGPELMNAIDQGVIIQWHRIQYYDPAPLMHHWSVWALNMRESFQNKGFKSLRRCVKKIMNSLPGKWGQRIKRWMDVDWQPSPKSEEGRPDEWFMEWGIHPANGEITTFRTVAGQTQYQDREELSPVSCPSVAAFWTSAGRCALAGLICCADAKNVYYYDTDSLIVNEQGKERLVKCGLVHDTRPGHLKLKETSDDVEILGIRRYRFGPRWCVAGPFGGEKTGIGAPGVLHEHEGFGHQMWHQSVGDSVKVKRQAKWRREYKHGIVLPDGKISPFVVGDPCRLSVAPVES